MLLAPAVMPVGDRRRDQYAQRLGLRGDGHWKMPDVLPIGHQHRRLVSLVGAGYLHLAYTLPVEYLAGEQPPVIGVGQRFGALADIRLAVQPHQIQHSVIKQGVWRHLQSASDVPCIGDCEQRSDDVVFLHRAVRQRGLDVIAVLFHACNLHQHRRSVSR